MRIKIHTPQRGEKLNHQFTRIRKMQIVISLFFILSALHAIYMFPLLNIINAIYFINKNGTLERARNFADMAYIIICVVIYIRGAIIVTILTNNRPAAFRSVMHGPGVSITSFHLMTVLSIFVLVIVLNHNVDVYTTKMSHEGQRLFFSISAWLTCSGWIAIPERIRQRYLKNFTDKNIG